MEDAQEEFRGAYAAWTADLGDPKCPPGGEWSDPVKLKGLLNHEVRANERYRHREKALPGILD